MQLNCFKRHGLSRAILLATAILSLARAVNFAAEKAQVLINGKDLAGWRQPTGDWTVAGAVAVDPANAEKVRIKPGRGVVVNGPAGRTVDLVSESEFGDAQIHVEFWLPKHSNSGVYVMDRYEIQIYDSFGVEKDKYPGIECGGIYPRWIGDQNVEGHSPRANVSMPPGQWQSFDITFRAPRFDASGSKIANATMVKVVHNGKVIHENVEVTGPTRGGAAGAEKATGPIRLQGDHGPVAYRNLKVKALAPQ